MAQQYWDNGNNTRASEQRQGRRDHQRDQGGRYQTSGRFESGIEDTEYASDRESGEDMRGRGGFEQGGYYGSRGNLRDFEDRTSGRGGDFRGSDETRNYDRGGFSAGGRSRDRDYRSQYGGRSGRESGQQNQGFGYGREEQFGAQRYGMDQDEQSRRGWQGQQQSFRGRGPKGYQRSDERLKEMICEQLTEDPNIDASEITIEVSSGEVKLEGTVQDRRIKHEVEDLIADCSGVKEIHNHLRVRNDSGEGARNQSSQNLQSGQQSTGNGGSTRNQPYAQGQTSMESESGNRDKSRKSS